MLLPLLSVVLLLAPVVVGLYWPSLPALAAVESFSRGLIWFPGVQKWSCLSVSAEAPTVAAHLFETVLVSAATLSPSFIMPDPW